MRTLSLFKKMIALIHRESGTTLVEVLVSLAILGAISGAFLSGVASTTTTTVITDKLATAESLARSQMEWTKNADYVYGASLYTAAPLPDNDDHANYAVAIASESLNTPDDGIQKITVTVTHFEEEILTLVSYKVDK